MTIRIELIGDDSPTSAGIHRILVDPNWPDGVSPDRARIDHWMRDLAPSAWLRRRFGRDPVRWGTFRSRYLRQLRSKRRRALLAQIALLAGNADVVLLHGPQDGLGNHAAVIREILERDYELLPEAPPSP